MSTSSDSFPFSIAASWRVLVTALGAMMSAFARLLVALAFAPFRRLRNPRANRPTPASRLPVEVHLTDPTHQVEIERAIRATLVRCARTWAPRPLPFDRVEVLYGAPARGQATTFSRWTELPSVDGTPRHRSLTVLSLGLLDDQGQFLEAAEIAGAVAGQVRSILATRYSSESLSEPVQQPSSVAGEQAVGIPQTGPSSLPGATLRGRAARDLSVSPATGEAYGHGPRTITQASTGPAPLTGSPADDAQAGRAVDRGTELTSGGAARPLLHILSNVDPLHPSGSPDSDGTDTHS